MMIIYAVTSKTKGERDHAVALYSKQADAVRHCNDCNRTAETWYKYGISSERCTFTVKELTVF